MLMLLLLPLICYTLYHSNAVTIATFATTVVLILLLSQLLSCISTVMTAANATAYTTPVVAVTDAFTAAAVAI